MQTPEELELARIQGELAHLEEDLVAKELELATISAELDDFERLYISLVGRRLAELDRLNAEIAEALAAEGAEGPARAAKANAAAEEDVSEEWAYAPEMAFKPTEELRRLYRELAKRIHPDLAGNESDRARRNELMAAVNEAYAGGNLATLREMLHEWSSSPEAVQGDDVGSRLVRAIRTVARVRWRLEEIERKLGELGSSERFELWDRVERAKSDGRDLMADMVARIEGEIARAREELCHATSSAGQSDGFSGVK